MSHLFFALLGWSTVAQASSWERPPPEGVIVPPFERPVKRPMVQAALVLKGTIQSIHLQPVIGIPVATMTWQQDEWKPAGDDVMPLTDAFKAYVADRFAGYPDPERMGRWDFQMLRVKVDTVIASEPGVEVKAGDVVDLYVPESFGIRGQRLVAFAEHYVRESEGTVSPWSEAGKAFVLPSMDISSTLIYEAGLDEACPGKAFASGGYVLFVATTAEQLDALSRRVERPRDGDSVSHKHLDATLGGIAEINSFYLSESPWECGEFKTLDTIAKEVRARR